MGPNLCEECNSEIVRVDKSTGVSFECSYCGEKYGDIKIDDLLDEE